MLQVSSIANFHDNKYYILEQRFSNYGWRTACGPRDLPLWSLKNTEENLKFK